MAKLAKSVCLTGMEAEVKQRPSAQTLLKWYDRYSRDLPWREKSGDAIDPYRIWLSEIMLQQTTVAAVVPYYETFLKRWPTVDALAVASLDDVLHAWAGLGYYSRARNLHRCAQTIVSEKQGLFPSTEKELIALPGIGPYTAAAIAAIAFDRKATVVDGNVERVLSRIFALKSPLPKSKPEIKRLATELTPSRRPGDYAQAIMDLGATICTPRNPVCGDCPWRKPCQAKRLDDPTGYPRRVPKKSRPRRKADVYVAVTEGGEVFVRQRPPKGLLGGLWEFPSSPWVDVTETEPEGAGLQDRRPFDAEWQATGGLVKHTFTHFDLELRVWVACLPKRCGVESGEFVPIGRLGTYAFPTVMKKVRREATRNAPQLN